MALNVSKMHTSLEAAFSQASMLSANIVSVSPRTLCLHDGRNARMNYEVKDLAFGLRATVNKCFSLC